MNRVRCLVNAELNALLPNGSQKVVQIGAGTYLEVISVELFKEDGDVFADINLSDNSILYGVFWSSEFWENHGAPEIERKVEEKHEEPVLEPTEDKFFEEDE